VYPCDAALPATSNLNVRPNEDRAGFVLAVPDAAGCITLHTQAGGHLVVDANGTIDAERVTLLNRRLFDARSSTGPALANTVATASAISSVDATMLGQLTVVPVGLPGFARLWPSGSTEPATSNANFGNTDASSNAVIVPMSASLALRSNVPAYMLVDALVLVS
jgi:hypothetical protein